MFKVALVEMERGGWIWGGFCRSVNVLDMKDQKRGIRNSYKTFGLSNQMIVPFAWIRGGCLGQGFKKCGNQKFCLSLRCLVVNTPYECEFLGWC